MGGFATYPILDIPPVREPSSIIRRVIMPISGFAGHKPIAYVTTVATTYIAQKYLIRLSLSDMITRRVGD